MRGNLVADLMALRKRPACWVLLAAWLVLDLVFAYLLPLIGYASGQGRPAAGLPTAEAALRSTLPDQLLPNALGGMAVFGGAIAVIFGALTTGGDYALGTVKTALLQRHGRVAVTTAKLGAIATVTLFTVVVTMAAGAVTSLVVAWSTGRSIDWPTPTSLGVGFLGGWLVITMWALFGAVLGYLLRGVALPIGLGLVWVMAVENLIANVLADLVSWLRPVRDLLPAANSGALIRAITAKVDLGQPAPGVTDVVTGTHATVTLLCYAALFAGGSILLVRSRDLP
jgi:hypothetical protein